MASLMRGSRQARLPPYTEYYPGGDIMFRDFLSSRALHVGFVLFVLIVGGTQLYSWHVRRGIKADEARTQRILRGLTAREGMRAAPAAAAPTDTEALEPLDVSPTSDDISQGVSVVMEGDNATRVDTAGALDLSLFEMDETTDVDAPYGVSPFGFGPYPKVPPDFPEQDIWDDVSTSSMSPDHELIARVQLELWNRGVYAPGAVFNSKYRLIYPILDDVVYVEWADSMGADGEPYISRWLTSPAVDDGYFEDILKNTLPPQLTVYEFPDGGIDPYKFLNLPR